MIKLYLANILNKKRSIILMIALLLINVFIAFTSNVFMPINDQLINKNDLLIEYQNYYKIIEILIVVAILLLIMDHDEKYQVIYISLIGRKKENITKTLIYVSIITVLAYVVFQVYLSIPFLFSKYFEFDATVLIKMLSSYLIFISLFFLVSIFVDSKKKPLVFLVLLIYIMVTFMLEEVDNFIVFYLFPFSTRMSLETKYGLTYQILYVLLLSSINFIYANQRSIN